MSLGFVQMAELDAEEKQNSENDLEKAYFLEDLGYFADGTPLTNQSLETWNALEMSERIKRNSVQLKKLVVSWDSLVKEPLSINAARYHYVFFHIPKTGGTTLEHIIAKNILPNHFIHANAPALNRNPSIMFYKSQRSIGTLMGHYERSCVLYQFLSDRPIIHFTMLREPIQRVVSFFNYIKTRPKHPLHERAKDWTLEDYAKANIEDIQNGQALRIVGDLTHEAGQRSLDEPAPLLAEAKAVLEEEFSLFGITERYTEFLIMAKRLLGWKEIVYTHKNVSKRNDRTIAIIDSISPDNTAMEMIRERNQVDIELYQFACELFDYRCEQLGITSDIIDVYEKLTSNYKGILAETESL